MAQVDKKTKAVVRPLINKKKGLGSFMICKAAYVPFDESWIVFIDKTILKGGLGEEDAKNFCDLVNAGEWLVKNSIKTVQKKTENFDFETIYELYPRKIGKKLGIKRLLINIKTPEKFQLLKEAVQTYAAFCLEHNTEEKFIKHFSTWVNAWEDWIPNDTDVNSLPQYTFDDITKQIQG